jgi:hypothetical protein
VQKPRLILSKRENQPSVYKLNAKNL